MRDQPAKVLVQDTRQKDYDKVQIDPYYHTNTKSPVIRPISQQTQTEPIFELAKPLTRPPITQFISPQKPPPPSDYFNRAELHLSPSKYEVYSDFNSVPQQ